MKWSQASVKGLVREENEDSFCIWPDIGLFAVADGMGGHQAGEVASNLALKYLRESISEDPTVTSNPEASLLSSVRYANREVFHIASQSKELQGMGTTVTASLILGGRLVYAHVGDSRIYLIRAGDIHQLTKDHSLVQEMVRKGELTREQAIRHPQKNVLTRALGTASDVVVDTANFGLQKGDRILLCTDGLTRHVGDREILKEVFKKADLKEIIDSLLEIAFAKGGTDNITVIIIEI
ncbi:MAG TPA: Stp1/IreP family PP2C-type Ser/Thr phosphatase [Clostridia bacterium]|nr:Stp1/IreP family PP2C-type Ser/Thr phosphatase [Clostridia bacterium]